MVKRRLISNFFSKTFPLLKWESMLPELSDREHHKASAGPGGCRIVDTSRVGMHTAPVCLENTPNPPDHPEGRKEAEISYNGRA